MTARIVEEVVGEPGALPLMSHALLETWRRRRGRMLTERAWDAAGGLRGAIAATAEEVYARLSPDEAAEVRRVLLRLVAPGEGTPDTRRPATRRDLGRAPRTPAGSWRNSHGLGSSPWTATVDLAHEALLSGWPRLRAWIDEDRELLRVHRRLAEDAATWNALGRDRAPSTAALASAPPRKFRGDRRRNLLTEVERAFLTGSTDTRDRETRAAVRAARRLRTLIISLSALLVSGLVAGGLAWHQTGVSEQQQRLALSRRLAAQSAAELTTDPDTAALTAIAAYRTSPTIEATKSLYAAGLPSPRGTVRGLRTRGRTGTHRRRPHRHRRGNRRRDEKALARRLEPGHRSLPHPRNGFRRCRCPQPGRPYLRHPGPRTCVARTHGRRPHHLAGHHGSGGDDPQPGRHTASHHRNGPPRPSVGHGHRTAARHPHPAGRHLPGTATAPL